MAIALILSALAMTLIVAVRYLLTSGLFAAWTARRFPGRLAGQGRQIRRDRVEPCLGGDLRDSRRGWSRGWQERGWTRIYSDAALSRRGGCRRRCSSICWFTMRGFTGRTG